MVALLGDCMLHKANLSDAYPEAPGCLAISTIPRDRTGDFDPMAFLDVCEGYEIVSFDVFDTLVFRKCVRPHLVFDYVGRVCDVPDFRRTRVRAEEAARLHNYARYSSHEVDLNDIYAHVRLGRHDKRMLMASELDAERELTFPNKLLSDAIRLLRERGQMVIAISDTYLLPDQVNMLLATHGVGVDRIFTSAEFKEVNAGKYNGEIFPRILGVLGAEPEKIIHFGDNKISDYEMPLLHDIAAVRLRTIMEMAYVDPGDNLHRYYILGQLDSFEAALLEGLQIKRSGIARTSYQSFGYNYAGPLVVAFALWILEQARLDGRKRLILFGRDGFIIKEAIEHLGFRDIEVEVLPISRRMAVFALAAVDLDVFLDFFPTREDYDSALSRLGLLGCSKVVDTFKRLHRTGQTVNVRAFVRREYETYEGLAGEEHRALLKAVADRTATHQLRDIAFVDVGWGLTIHRILDRLLEEPVAGYYLGRHEDAYDNGRIRCMAFDGLREIGPTQTRSFRCIELFELAFSYPVSSARKYVLKSDAAVVEYENDHRPEALRRLVSSASRSGVLTFVNDIKPYVHALDCSKIVSAALENFLCLVENSCPSERALLECVPHNREIGSGIYKTIKEYWATDVGNRSAAPPPIVRQQPRVLVSQFKKVVAEAGFATAVSKAIRYVSKRLAN